MLSTHSIDTIHKWKLCNSSKVFFFQNRIWDTFPVKNALWMYIYYFGPLGSPSYESAIGCELSTFLKHKCPAWKLFWKWTTLKVLRKKWNSILEIIGEMKGFLYYNLIQTSFWRPWRLDHLWTTFSIVQLIRPGFGHLESIFRALIGHCTMTMKFGEEEIIHFDTNKMFGLVKWSF